MMRTGIHVCAFVRSFGSGAAAAVAFFRSYSHSFSFPLHKCMCVCVSEYSFYFSPAFCFLCFSYHIFRFIFWLHLVGTQKPKLRLEFSNRLPFIRVTDLFFRSLFLFCFFFGRFFCWTFLLFLLGHAVLFHFYISFLFFSLALRFLRISGKELVHVIFSNAKI